MANTQTNLALKYVQNGIGIAQVQHGWFVNELSDEFLQVALATSGPPTQRESPRRAADLTA